MSSPKVAVFPNPTRDILFLAITDASSDKKADLNTQASATGRIVIKDRMGVTRKSMNYDRGANKIEINVRDLPFGVYFGEVWNGKERLTFKFNKL